MSNKFIAIFEDGEIVNSPDITEESQRVHGLKRNGKRPKFIFIYRPVTDSLIRSALFAVHPMNGKVFVDNLEL